MTSLSLTASYWAQANENNTKWRINVISTAAVCSAGKREKPQDDDLSDQGGKLGGRTSSLNVKASCEKYLGSDILF